MFSSIFNMDTFKEVFSFRENISTIQIATAVTFLLLIICYNFFHYYNVPPGPWGIPLLGYWLFLKSEESHLHMEKLRQKYGEVFSFTITGRLFICMNSLKTIKEAHISKSECFEDRFSGFSLITHSFEGGVTVVNGESWKIQRKFFLQKFKEFGMITIKENAAASVYETLKESVEEIRATKGKPFSVTELLSTKCSSIIRRILFNDQGISEEELKELNEEYVLVLFSMTLKNMLLMGNFARYFVFPFMPCYWAMLRGHNRIQIILKNIVNRHKSNFDENQIMDIIDCFYKEKKDRERKGDPTAKYFTDKALLSSVYQFVTDGVLTVSFFIGIILEKLLKHPEEQEKIYEELLEIIGPDRQPTMEDKSNLPYTNAFIYEVIRFYDIFPFFPSLTCTRETTLNGYRIPKGAVTVLNVWSAHHDPKVYKDPYKFNPSRFIATPGKQRAELPIILGVGKRACMGEPFTMIQTFLFLTTLVKNFRLSLPESSSNSILVEAKELRICAHPRTPEFQTVDE